MRSKQIEIIIKLNRIKNEENLTNKHETSKMVLVSDISLDGDIGSPARPVIGLGLNL